MEGVFIIVIYKCFDGLYEDKNIGGFYNYFICVILNFDILYYYGFYGLWV